MNELIIGSKLQNGKYEITKVLGSGNFGITYLASTKIEVKGQIGQMDVSINVAIKEFYMKDLNNRMSDGTTVEGTQNTMVKNYRQKFKKEAENLAKLHHPNIVKVIEVFDENNTTYYVMEYVEGGSLDDYIKSKGRLTEEEALQCTLEIADALSYMHKNMMIHLDLKPKNIMRNSKGHLYLIDFGLSKQYDENGEPESSTSIGLGTPGYAPLEQASYKQDGTLPVTLDIYALGASLYKMLVGKTPPESSYILNEGFPSSALLQIGISKDTISVVEKAMASMKKDRYQTVDSLSKALEIVSVHGDSFSSGNTDDKTVYEEEKTSYDEASVYDAQTNCEYLPNGTVLGNGRFMIKSIIGAGGFSNAYLAVTTDCFEKRVVIKEFYLRKICYRDHDGKKVLIGSEKGKEEFSMFVRKFKSEANRLNQLHHHNIISVIDVFDSNGTAYYVMDYFEGDTLSDVLSKTGNPLGGKDIWLILNQVLDALEYLHNKKVYHLDINPRNIMMDKKGHICLIDFGLSKQYDEKGEPTTSTSPNGYTPRYSPGEQTNMSGNKIGPWTDFYALGATLYKIASNNQPPSFTDIINDGNDAFKGLKDISPILQRTILWMMSPKINKRPQSVTEIRDSLSPTHIPTQIITGDKEEDSVIEIGQGNDKYSFLRLFLGKKKDFKNRNGLVNSILILLQIASVILIVICSGDSYRWFTTDGPEYNNIMGENNNLFVYAYAKSLFMGLPISFIVLFCNGLILNMKRKGIIWLVLLSIISVIPTMFVEFEFFLFAIGCILPCIFVYFLVLQIPHKGKSVWNMCK